MRVVYAYLILISGIVVLSLLSVAYELTRKKLNKSVIGYSGLLKYFLKKGDHVYLGGRVLRFSHFASEGESLCLLKPPFEDNKTLGGELVFYNPHGIGYVYFYPSALNDCQFIYGKYGLKWAINLQVANNAQSIIENSET